jgi:hypothetical protein
MIAMATIRASARPGTPNRSSTKRAAPLVRRVVTQVIRERRRERRHEIAPAWLDLPGSSTDADRSPERLLARRRPGRVVADLRLVANVRWDNPAWSLGGRVPQSPGVTRQWW